VSDAPSPTVRGPLERTPASEDRLDSWKEIATYLKKDATTAQRWEKREGMPVHRHLHDKGGSVYAFRSELDAWSRGRAVTAATEVRPQIPSDDRPRPSGGDPGQAARASSAAEPGGALEGPVPAAGPRRPRTIWWCTGSAAALLAALLFWQSSLRGPASENQLSGAHFVQLTDFGGREQAAALSRDGRFVAFLSDRDGPMDVWVTQIGSGRFYNLTRGAAAELVNPSVRTLGFSPDGTLVTFWARRSVGSGPSDISVWAAPVLGGPARPYLEGAAEFDWSSDGTRLVYHTPGPGDPTFVRGSGQPTGRQIYSAPAGLHAHFPTWSPDQAFIYFAMGAVPDGMDLWRMRSSGAAPERITNHRSGVSHPVFLNAQTLLYLASDSEGPGLRLYSLDLRRGVSHRIALGVERYTSLSASADGRRLVVTVSSPRRTLWRLPLTGTQIDSSAARRIALTTESGFAPRLGSEFLVYVSSNGESDSIWKLQGEAVTELWGTPGTRVVGAPVLSRDGDHVAFVVERNGQRSLHVANTDGTNARTLSPSLEVQGTPAWAPDGQSVTVAAAVGGGLPHLFSVPVDGRPPTSLVEEQSVDPLWSPDGSLLFYSGPDIGTTFEVKAVAVNGRAPAVPRLTLRRGSRHLAFMPGGRSLIVLRGDLAHEDLWSIDLETGAERQLTRFAPDFIVRDFDISPDGREVVLEQARERSDVFLIDLPKR
jgi:Tol biopolymer transport system component